MALNPTALATARRNVAERIDRFLIVLDRAGRMPNRRELFWLRQALASFDNADHPAGEDAMDKAERALAIPEHAANEPSTNANVTLEQLRSQLDQIMKAGGGGPDCQGARGGARLLVAVQIARAAMTMKPIANHG